MFFRVSFKEKNELNRFFLFVCHVEIKNLNDAHTVLSNDDLVLYIYSTCIHQTHTVVMLKSDKPLISKRTVTRVQSCFVKVYFLLIFA